MRRNAKDVLDKPGPLEGITVIEYGLFHAGPGASAILGDLGAKVIKIESGSGDPMRVWRKVGDKNYAKLNGSNPMFEVSNRNKQCIYLDIKHPKGRELFNRLVKSADVFLTNLRQSTKPKLGIDYETISALNSKIIYACVTGYGKEGPVSNHGGFDPLGQARSGMMHLTAAKEPTFIQLAILDQATAIALSQAITTALYTRERDDIGQEVHVSLYSSALWLMYINLYLTNFDLSMKDLQWVRYRNPPLRNNFQCKDGKWIASAHHPTEKFWTTFCEATKQFELESDPRFVDEDARSHNCAELIEHFDMVFATKDRDDWLEILSNAGLMFSPIQDIEDVPNDPQAIANDYIVDFDHPRFGKVYVPGFPIDFSSFSAGIRKSAPGIGEHTDEILSELGISSEEISDLKKCGVVQQNSVL